MSIPIKVWIVIVALVGVGAIALAGRAQLRSSQMTFVPNPGNDKILITSGWGATELERILKDFQSIYKDRFHASFAIKSVQVNSAQFHVTFPNDIEPSLFHFLVNYARYPKDFDLSNRTILIAGRATLDKYFALPSSILIGQQVLIYVPVDDHDFDLVYVRTEQGVVYKDSFASSSWKIVQTPRLPSGIETLK